VNENGFKIIRLDQKDAPKVNELVSKAFGYLPPDKYFDDFPIWNSNSAIRLGLLDGSKLASHVGVRFTLMKTSKGAERVALIGAVATDEAYRGKGCSTKLLTEAIRLSEEKGNTWIFLWGSEHGFYEKFGFHLSGEQLRAKIRDLQIDPKLLVGNDPGQKVKPEIKTGLTERIFEFMCQTQAGVELTLEDHDWFFAHKNVKWFSLEKPFSFIAYQRGMDLQHIVHEYGGDLSGIETLLYHIYQIDPDAQIIGNENTLMNLGFSEDRIIQEYLCMARSTPPNQIWNPEFWISGLSAC